MTPLHLIDTRPTFKTIVPSTGKKIEFKPYVTKQEKLLLMAAEAGDLDSMISAVETLIKECTEGIEVSKLTTFDGEYLFSQIRAKSAGEVDVLKIECQHCSAVNEYEYRYDREFDAEIIDPPRVDINKKVFLQLQWPLFKDLRSISLFKSETDQLFFLMDKVIESIGTEDEISTFSEYSDKERSEFIGNLPPTVSREIQKFLSKIPSHTKDITFTCGSCKSENVHAAKGIAGFFS